MTDSKQRSSIFLSTVLPAIFVVLGVGGLYAMYRTRPISADIRPPQLAPLVETVPVAAHPGGVDIRVDGVVTPYREIELSAEVSGRIVSKSPVCRAGRFVARGTILLEIDRRDYELELQRLNDQLKQSQSSIAECDVELSNVDKLIQLAQEEHELQKKELVRVQRLAGAVSDSDIDKVKRGEWSSRNNLLTLQNQIQLINSRRRGLENARDLVQTQIEKATLDLERTTIRSPVDGVLVRDVVEQDSFVQKGSLLAVVEDTSKVEVRCNLKMDELIWIWRQADAGLQTRSKYPQPAAPIPTFTQGRSNEAADATSPERENEPVNELRTISADEPASLGTSSNAWRPHYELPQTPVTVSFHLHGNPTRYVWRGSLTRFDGSGIDERTRTVPCRVVVDDPRSMTIEGNDSSGPRALVRGMFVTVSIHAQPQSDFVRIPESAVQPGKMTFRVRDGKLDVVGPLQLVQLMEAAGTSGLPKSRSWIAYAMDLDLQAGDKVIVSPLPGAHAGMEVREQSAR